MSPQLREDLAARFADLGSRPALVEDDGDRSFADLLAEIETVRAALDAYGVRPHDVVVLAGDVSARSVAALFALFWHRAVVVPVAVPDRQTLAAIAEVCGAGHVLTPGSRPRLEPLPAVAGDRDGRGESAGRHSATRRRLAASGAAGLVLLSSGSTGTAKMILHDFDALIAAKLRRRARGGTRAPAVLMVLMFDHIGGINSLLSTVLGGGRAVLPATRTPAEICRLIERHQVRVLPTSPTFLNLMLVGGHHRRHDVSSLRMITYGTEPMPDGLLGRVHAAFPGVRLLQTFGTSETGIATTTSAASDSTFFRFSDRDVEHRIIDGELYIRSTTQFLGYLNASDEAVTEDGWFRTGDIVEEIGDGYLRILGRATEVINVGGEKLLPFELESILLTSPLIEECVVYGRPNALTGQSVCVDVKPATSMPDRIVRQRVRAFLAERVPPYKVPAKINVVDTVAVSERFKKVRGSR
ncbi:AMP-binding protein [Streptomyces sp. NA02950]|uniref:class I adenylate-forming enzyme family protein n=1 Tax=Streptomyces sp. NA02950 TaxID=2742137 RepID=UPI0015914DC7|nr:fatty acid--CoA ligase family protein [Streptomyces sp. NA02950]QKV90697.1 AMP-binding protein [Streptomyces sp. NA02950]